MGESGVNENGVAKLNHRLAVLALGGIFFAAIQILLLAYIGIPRATRAQGCEKRASQQQKDGNRATHIRFSNCGRGDEATAFIRKHLIILQGNRGKQLLES
jgi:hypothetical protein